MRDDLQPELEVPFPGAHNSTYMPYYFILSAEYCYGEELKGIILFVFCRYPGTHTTVDKVSILYGVAFGGNRNGRIYGAHQL